jgi:hypothetical protein
LLYETNIPRTAIMMEDQPFFADVDLPFHVWVREGPRWVLRDAAPRLLREGAVRTRAANDCDAAPRDLPPAA